MVKLKNIPAVTILENFQNLDVWVIGSNQVAQGTQFRIWAYEGVSSFSISKLDKSKMSSFFTNKLDKSIIFDSYV
jgi:hypothetical protein